MSVGVTIPVGPMAHHGRYLVESLASVLAQTHPPDEIVIVDDMHDIEMRTRSDRELEQLLRDPRVYVWRAPWRLGVAGAFNAGVAICDADIVVMLGADDRLRPTALEQLAGCVGDAADPALYWFEVEYSDGELQALPCNAAGASKALWHWSGGFSPEMGLGAMDAAFISVLMVHRPGALRRVPGGPLYWVRRHAEQETVGKDASWQGPIMAVRNLVTRDFRPLAPMWGRRTP